MTGSQSISSSARPTTRSSRYAPGSRTAASRLDTPRTLTVPTHSGLWHRCGMTSASRILPSRAAAACGQHDSRWRRCGEQLRTAPSRVPRGMNAGCPRRRRAGRRAGGIRYRAWSRSLPRATTGATHPGMARNQWAAPARHRLASLLAPHVRPAPRLAEPSPPVYRGEGVRCALRRRRRGGPGRTEPPRHHPPADREEAGGCRRAGPGRRPP